MRARPDSSGPLPTCRSTQARGAIFFVLFSFWVSNKTPTRRTSVRMEMVVRFWSIGFLDDDDPLIWSLDQPSAVQLAVHGIRSRMPMPYPAIPKFQPTTHADPCCSFPSMRRRGGRRALHGGAHASRTRARCAVRVVEKNGLTVCWFVTRE